LSGFAPDLNESGVRRRIAPPRDGIADKDRIAEIRVSLSRTLIELISSGVTEYSELLRLAVEKLSARTSGTAVVRN
jgi:hypothetical protein